MSIDFEKPLIKSIGGKRMLLWQDKGCEYIVQGLTQTFNWLSWVQTSDACADISDTSPGEFLQFRVKYGVFCEGVFVEYGVSEPVDFEYEAELRKIELHACRSFFGISFAFYDDIIYDLYKLYKSDDKSGECFVIGETEDPQILLYEDTGGVYYAEGYMEDGNGGYVLHGVSEKTVFADDDLIGRFEDSVLTVICPVYNAENFVSRTIDSILLSSFRKITVLLIDDGSTDSSGMICDWYAENYPCVKVVHQENVNRSVTRNRGLALVETPYTAFIDADDLVHPYMYEKLYNYLIENDLDISVSQTLARDAVGKKEIIFDDCSEKMIYSYNDYIAAKLAHRRSIYYCVVWNHIAKTYIAESVPFPDENYPNQLLPYEDNAYVIALYSWANKIGYVPDAWYMYERRQRGTTGTVSTDDYKRKYGGFNAHDIYIRSLEYGLEHCNPEYLEKTAHSVASDVAREVTFNKYPEPIVRKYCDFCIKWGFADNSFVKSDAKLAERLSKLIGRNA